jgi:hypothetical protein
MGRYANCHQANYAYAFLQIVGLLSGKLSDLITADEPQLPGTNRQLLTVNRQPSTVNRHPSSVIRHPSTVIHQPFMLNFGP